MKHQVAMYYCLPTNHECEAIKMKVAQISQAKSHYRNTAKMALSYILLLVAVSSFVESSSSSQQNSTLPVIISPAVLSGGDVGACPSSDSMDSLRQTVREKVATTLQDISPTNCPCGSLGQWTNIADFNFSDPDAACPSGLTLITDPVRGCGRAQGEAATCKSVIFSPGGQSYSRVCGRVNAYQEGTTDAFHFNAGLRGLEEIYVDGVSLTHGAPGSRQHIWTFATAVGEASGASASICDCTDTEEDWPYEVYSYIGNNYFCATGNPGSVTFGTVFADNPLWDGEGCGATNACCQFNNPPWFCTTLPQPTTDDIEMRLCNNQNEGDEDVIISFVNINIK